MVTINIVRICGQVAAAHLGHRSDFLFHSLTICIVFGPSQILFHPRTMVVDWTTT
jgi:hypothetical protein